MHKAENESDSSYAFQREHAEERRVGHVEATKNGGICLARAWRRERYQLKEKSSSNSCFPGTSAQRRSATRHGEHHRNARRPYAGHRDAATPWRFDSSLSSSSRCCAAQTLFSVGVEQRSVRDDDGTGQQCVETPQNPGSNDLKKKNENDMKMIILRNVMSCTNSRMIRDTII